MLYHIGLSAPWLRSPGDLLAGFLAPRERTLMNQTWALSILWESASYYPVGSDSNVLSHFDITIGSNRDLHRVFSMSYSPDWARILHPYSLYEKLGRRVVPARSNVTLLVSNCGSKSGRESYLADLLALLPVDSFGRCFRNREEPQVASEVLGFFDGLIKKHEVAYGYKFLLAFENSIETDYVTEKIFDAWEAHAVPVYRGAPNIADYAVGPHSFIEVDDAMTPSKLAALISYLDNNDTAYAEYHAWRNLPQATIVHASPLGRLVDLHDSQPTPMCALCAAVNARRGLG